MNTMTQQSKSLITLEPLQFDEALLQRWLDAGAAWQDARRDAGTSDTVHAHHRQSAGIGCLLLHGPSHEDVMVTAMSSVHNLYGQVVTDVVNDVPRGAAPQDLIERMTVQLRWLTAGVPDASKITLPSSFNGYMPLDNLSAEKMQGELLADGRRNLMRTLSDMRDTALQLERAANWLARLAITLAAVSAVHSALIAVEEVRMQCNGLEQRAKEAIERVKQAQAEQLKTNAGNLEAMSGLQRGRSVYAGNVAPDDCPIVCDRYVAALLSAVQPEAKRRWSGHKAEPTHSADHVQQSFEAVARVAKHEAEILGVTHHDGVAVALVVPCHSTNPDDVIAVDAHKFRFLLETVEWNGLNMGEQGVALLWQDEPVAVMTHVYTARYDARTTYCCKVDVAEARRVRAGWSNPAGYEQRWIERAAQLVASAEETAQTC